MRGLRKRERRKRVGVGSRIWGKERKGGQRELNKESK
jgi:hypothetical protein